MFRRWVVAPALLMQSPLASRAGPDEDTLPQKACEPDEDTLLQRTCEPDEDTLLQVANSHKDCPAEVQELSASPKPFHGDGPRVDRVVLADYPSTGSTWLRKLLDAAVAEVDAVPSPDCSIYQERSMNHAFEKVFCNEGWNADTRKALFKTHFPAQELFGGAALADWQYEASMALDRLVLLLRHPVSTVASNFNRWRTGRLHQTGGALSCWASWWQRVMNALGSSRVLVVRYEDLCVDTAKELERILHFLGGAYGNVSASHAQAALRKNQSLRCYYSPLELQWQAEARDLGIDSRHILPYVSEWFWQHGYTSNSVALKSTSEAPVQMTGSASTADNEALLQIPG